MGRKLEFALNVSNQTRRATTREQP